MHITCPSCNSPIRAEDMNLGTMAAKCRRCNALIDLRHFLGSGAPSSGEIPVVERRPVPLPRGITMDRSGTGLRITRRWFGLTYLPLMFFCVTWDSFLIFWYWITFTTGAPWIAIVFPALHVAVGVSLTYYVLAGLLNRSIVTVAGGRLSISHGPLPWRGNRDLPVDQLVQLFAQAETHRTKSGTGLSYAVCAILASQQKIVLLSGLTDVEQALFVEQSLEQHLGITDRPEPGEIPR